MKAPGPQIIEAVHISLSQTIYDVKWLPGTSSFVALGCHPRGTGALAVYELDGSQLDLQAQAQHPQSLKCGSFGGGAAAGGHHLVLGDLGGQLQLLDLERLGSGGQGASSGADVPRVGVSAAFQVQAHRGGLNALDALCSGGSEASSSRLTEVVTCGQDGAVRVWDTRQPAAPATAFLPAAASTAAPDCWCVALGNAYGKDGQHRCVLAGYANGDVRMFDLRAARLRWETNVGKGVCGVQFDRRDIPMNKFVATCLESQLCLFEARTQHPTHGFAMAASAVTRAAARGEHGGGAEGGGGGGGGPRDATLWSAQHLPQNRDVFMVSAGDGSLSLHKYHYPDERSVKDADTGEARGVVGSTELLCDRTISCQPVSSFDWSTDKAGAFVAAAFDQTVRVGMVSHVNTL